MLLADIVLFIRITFVLPVSAGLPSIVLPILPFRSGPLDELYPSIANLWAVALQIVLTVAQVFFILSLAPFAVVFPGPIYAAYVVGFILFNGAFSVLINGTNQAFRSDVDMTGWPNHEDERWFFINGVAVGQHWLQSNLDRLALTFRRPIYGIQNPTRGILFDVIQCVIQRDFGYATNDIRKGYAELVDVLSNPGYKKVVLILHSQGAIEGSTILDWLYATQPSSQLQRLEVYTFGNAANHFNSPKGSLDSHPIRVQNGEPVEARLQWSSAELFDKNPENLRTSSRNRVDSDNPHIVKHVEHYVNTGDWVSKFGILHFLVEKSRFYGRVYARPDTGHQLNGNYLDNMFTMDRSVKHVLENNAFVDSVQGPEGRKVKDSSRLWRYRDGMSPKD